MKNTKLWILLSTLFLTIFFGGCDVTQSVISNLDAPENLYESGEVNKTISHSALDIDDTVDAPEISLESTQVDEDVAHDISDDQNDSSAIDDSAVSTENDSISEDGRYTDKDNVALYIHTFDKLPPNYITKSEAQKNGWNNKENTLSDVLPEMSIGGDRFGNYEELLPKEKGRTYKECDIDYERGARNAKRIVFSNDGLIFYTEDHYKSFEQLY